MTAPHTPQVEVSAAFGSVLADGVKEWTSLAAYRPRGVRISRGRPSELDRFKPASMSLTLTDVPARDLDPVNLSGPYTEQVTSSVFPVVNGTVAVDAGTSLGTNHAFSLPANVVVGELLIAYVSVDLNGGASGIATGAGAAAWTELFDAVNGTVVEHAAYARIATGSDTFVLTGPAQDYVVEIVRVGKHGCATTADIEVGSSATGNDAIPNPPSLGPLGEADWLWLPMATVDTTTTSVLTVSEALYTTIDTEISAVSTTSVGLMWAKRQLAATTEDPTPFVVNATRQWVANTIAVPPELTTTDRTQVVTGVPIRVVATTSAAETVLSDTAAGPELHSAWRVVEGAITGSISGSYPLPTGLVMTGPAFNFDEASSFQFGTSSDGATPNHDVRVVLGNGGYIGFNLTSTTLTYYVNDGGSTADDTVAWDDTTMRYLRFRIDGDDVVWERSADASAWNNIDTYTRGSDFASTVDWSFGYLYVENAGASAPSLDDFLVKCSRYTRFTGRVDGWRYSPLPGHGGATVDVKASDSFADLANTAFPQRWQEAVTALDPVAWYPLGDRDEGIAHDASGNGYDAVYPQPYVKQGEAPITPPLGNGAVRMVHKYPPYFGGIRLPDSLRRTSFPYTLNMWIRGDGSFNTDASAFAEGNSLPGMLAAQGANGTGQYFYYNIVSNQTVTSGDFSTIINWAIYSDVHTSPSDTQRSYHVAPIGDGLPHMITLVQSAVDDLVAYVDGARQHRFSTNTGFTLSPNFANVPGMWIGPPSYVLGLTVGGTAVDYNTPFWGMEGWFDEFTVHDTALTEDEVIELYEAGARLGAGDTTGERIHRVLDLIGWPDGARRIDTGTTTLQPDYLYGGTVLDYLQRVETTEGGRLFIGPHGEVVFHDANRIVTRGSDPVVFDGGSDGGVSIMGGTYAVDSDDAFLITGAQVRRDGGLEQTYRDDDAVARRGIRDWSATLMTRSDLEALTRAIGMVEVYKEPRPRVGAWQVAPELNPSDWPSVLTVGLGDTVRLTFTPLEAGDQFDEFLDLASIDEELSDGAWTLEFAGTPQDPGIGTFLILDGTGDDEGLDYGRLR